MMRKSVSQREPARAQPPYDMRSQIAQFNGEDDSTIFT